MACRKSVLALFSWEKHKLFLGGRGVSDQNIDLCMDLKAADVIVRVTDLLIL
jgi:hypothetical protein